MDVVFEDLIIRQILCNDDTSKLSVGDKSHAPLKTFLRKSANHLHVYGLILL